MAHIRLHTIDKVTAERDTTEEPFPVTVTLKDEDGDVVVFRLPGMSPGPTEEFRSQIRELLALLDTVLAEWEDQPDWDNDGYIVPPHENRGSHGWFVRFEGKDVAHHVPDRDLAMFLLAEAMTAAGYFPNVWETGRDWAPQGIDDEVRAFHDAGGTDLIPLEGVQYADNDEVEFLDQGAWESGTVHRDFGQYGIWVDGYGQDGSFFVDDRDQIRLQEDDA